MFLVTPTKWSWSIRSWVFGRLVFRMLSNLTFCCHHSGIIIFFIHLLWTNQRLLIPAFIGLRSTLLLPWSLNLLLKLSIAINKVHLFQMITPYWNVSMWQVDSVKLFHIYVCVCVCVYFQIYLHCVSSTELILAWVCLFSALHCKGLCSCYYGFIRREAEVQFSTIIHHSYRVSFLQNIPLLYLKTNTVHPDSSSKDKTRFLFVFPLCTLDKENCFYSLFF